MQVTTSFSELENVVLTPENYTREIQKNLEAFNYRKIYGSFELKDCFQKHQDIGFLHYEALDKEVIERLEYQIGKVSKDVNYGYACLSIGNVKNVYIKDIENDLVTYFELLDNRRDNQFWHAYNLNLKYTDYEIVYSIAKILCGCFRDNKVFNEEYNHYKAFFNGTEESFLDCFLYPKKLKIYGLGGIYIEQIPFFSDLQNKLTELKNKLLTYDEIKDLIIISPTPPTVGEQPITPPPATDQPINTRPFKEKLLPTFKEMFKVPTQFDEILVIIKPLLDENGALKVSPKGKYLQALFNDLEDKGYLHRGVYDYEQIANTLNVQFSTNLGNDTFKPSNRTKGDHYKIHFNNIPSIKS